MSPSAVKTIASSPSGTYATCTGGLFVFKMHGRQEPTRLPFHHPGERLARSAWHTVTRRERRSVSDSRVKRTMAHRLWMGSMILLEALQASAKRVVLL